MKRYSVSRTATVGAAAPDVYRLIADYERGHPRIVPPRYFGNMRVEQGGFGAGTVVGFDMFVLGRRRRAVASIAEPEPGRRLVETIPADGIVTTFLVEPAGTHSSTVTIETELGAPAGLLGWLQRTGTRAFLSRVYAAELKRIDQVARGTI